MKHNIVLRRDVPGDLSSIVTYLEQFSVSLADRSIESTFIAMNGLAEMPGKGSPKHFRSRRLSGIRSWSVPGFRKYLILYRSAPDGIEILAVTHGARDLRRLLLQRK